MSPGGTRKAATPAQPWVLGLASVAALGVTVVSVALASIQRDLRASLPDLQWVIDAYALVLAVLLLPTATLGDRLGRRRLFLAGLAIFTAGSLACALSPTALALELFRAFQGLGGAVLFATGTPLLRAEFSGRGLARALGAFGATIGGAIAIGPLAGGALTDTLGWRSIFFINVPIGVAAIAIGVARLRESREPRGGRADWLDTALITAAPDGAGVRAADGPRTRRPGGVPQRAAVVDRARRGPAGRGLTGISQLIASGRTPAGTGREWSG